MGTWASLLQGLLAPWVPPPLLSPWVPPSLPSPPPLSSSPLPLVPPLNLLLKQLTNLYPLVLFVCLFCLFVCVLHAQDYFKLFEVAKERQLNCELFFL